ncbi:hypothetical protein O9G_000270 [Rozella allomycis CSF55]|uniref:MICOS complex subunit n=1 Tax=Rozella allomycis (strain CSF55) TaxID=988480 RepID=A0A075AP49_ROZAC|nr:hypothetical protein O9G_000270 [Rozella allomycis CSF55]|eukprot:EPZ31791.1 hypothetical protein O9G_000270 [Rozella allomycis CSF55]
MKDIYDPSPSPVNPGFKELEEFEYLAEKIHETRQYICDKWDEINPNKHIVPKIKKHVKDAYLYTWHPKEHWFPGLFAVSAFTGAAMIYTRKCKELRMLYPSIAGIWAFRMYYPYTTDWWYRSARKSYPAISDAEEWIDVNCDKMRNFFDDKLNIREKQRTHLIINGLRERITSKVFAHRSMMKNP